MSKVFGIGLPKTGTSSLNRALEELGYKSVHHRNPDGPYKMECMIPDDMKRYDAGSDLPVVGFFEHFDSCYPGSKFVYTVREMNAWLASVCKAIYYVEYWRGNRKQPIRQIREEGSPKERDRYKMECFNRVFPDCPELFNREFFIRCYIEHERRVFEHFKNRKQDILVFDVRNGWEPLCKFLGKRVPKKPFPKKEASGYRWRQGREKIPEGLLY